MSKALPPGFLTIEAPAPAAPEQPEDEAPWRAAGRRRSALETTRFPEPVATGTPADLLTKIFACSGSPDSTRYQEATRYRVIPDMDWPDARVALNRLVVGLQGGYWQRHAATSAELVALAEFALTARTVDFQGRKGDHAPKFRKQLSHAISVYLHSHLLKRLNVSADNARVTARPIIDQLRQFQSNDALQAMIPLPDSGFVRIMEATPGQAFAALQYMRDWMADQAQARAFAEDVATRLGVGGADVTAQDYAAAISTADAVEFMSAKLVMLYVGIAHSIPLYRLYPTTPEREAIELWWPWGRAMPLVDGGPAKAPQTRKKVVDPAIITAKRPQDVVREVIERTGINRTTAQRMTADMRADMRRSRKAIALSMLRRGETRTAVARTVGLSPSRISAMFKSQKFPTKKTKRADNPADDGDVYDDEEGEDEDVQVGTPRR
jgi:hypothetical protein